MFDILNVLANEAHAMLSPAKGASTRNFKDNANQMILVDRRSLGGTGMALTLGGQGK